MVLQSHSQSGHLDGLGVGVRDEWVVDWDMHIAADLLRNPLVEPEKNVHTRLLRMQKQMYDRAVLLNQMLKNFVNNIKQNNDTLLIK